MSKSDCGAACRELKPREFAFHLRKLAGDSNVDACISTAKGGRKVKRDSARASGAEILARASVTAAMAHHREVEAIRYRATKDAQVRRLADQAAGSSVEHFVEMDGETVTFKDWKDVPKGLLRGVAGIEQTVSADGSETTIKLKIRDPVNAERALADLLGHNAPKDVHVTGLEGIAKAIGAEADELPDP